MWLVPILRRLFLHGIVLNENPPAGDLTLARVTHNVCLSVVVVVFVWMRIFSPKIYCIIRFLLFTPIMT